MNRRKKEENVSSYISSRPIPGVTCRGMSINARPSDVPSDTTQAIDVMWPNKGGMLPFSLSVNCKSVESIVRVRWY